MHINVTYALNNRVKKVVKCSITIIAGGNRSTCLPRFGKLTI
ncbi:MAG: hypothetical protein WBC98_05045 [Candidatus Zixiibacteriota bacterium]